MSYEKEEEAQRLFDNYNKLVTEYFPELPPYSFQRLYINMLLKALKVMTYFEILSGFKDSMEYIHKNELIEYMDPTIQFTTKNLMRNVRIAKTKRLKSIRSRSKELAKIGKIIPYRPASCSGGDDHGSKE